MGAEKKVGEAREKSQERSGRSADEEGAAVVETRGYLGEHGMSLPPRGNVSVLYTPVSDKIFISP